MKKKNVKRGVMVRVEDYQQPLPDLIEVEDEITEHPEKENQLLQLPLIVEERNSLVRNSTVARRPSVISRPSIVSRSSFHEQSRPTKSTVENDQEDEEITRKRRQSIKIRRSFHRERSFYETEEAQLYCSPEHDGIKAMKQIDQMMDRFHLATVASKAARRKIRVYQVPKSLQKLAVPKQILKPEPIPDYKLVLPKRMYYKLGPEIKYRDPPCPMTMSLNELKLWLPIERKSLNTTIQEKKVIPKNPIKSMVTVLKVKHDKLPGILKDSPSECK